MKAAVLNQIAPIQTSPLETTELPTPAPASAAQQPLKRRSRSRPSNEGKGESGPSFFISRLPFSPLSPFFLSHIHHIWLKRYSILLPLFSLFPPVQTSLLFIFLLLIITPG